MAKRIIEGLCIQNYNGCLECNQETWDVTNERVNLKDILSDSKGKKLRITIEYLD